ncbi:MAG: DUF402 domain-containing protein [Clostridiales bacterium]|jgi:predicted RNA-binding protein associated with RNAse of E/G family|nr:DUF402 domain-containing protein [Clostridiales bacterium]
MRKPALFRKRLIPFETVPLKDDVIELLTDEIIVTRWKALKPREDFYSGVSCYFLKQGLKISRFFDKSGKPVYYYCDIIETVYNKEENCYTFIDLLADAAVYEDGFVKVMDLGEIADALDSGLIDVETAKKALRTLDRLLDVIYAKEFGQFTRYLQ